MNSSRVEEAFPVIRSCIYLNHAAVSPWPARTATAVCEFAQENAARGSENYLEWLQTERRLRHRAATLVNAPSADDIALVKNTSEGISFVAAGLDWKQGDNVVGIAQEFPSNRLAWLALAPLGVCFRQLDLTRCGDDIERGLIALCDANTKVLAISAVQYSNGLRLDLPRLGAFCRAKGILFCIDAIQQIGALNFDVQQCQADFAIADGHKWMMGPEGLGIFYVRQEMLNRIKPSQFGWHMSARPGDYEEPAITIADTARRFESGSPNMLGIHALDASLGLLLDTGIDEIERRVIEHSQHLESEFQLLRRCQILSDCAPHRRSGIFTFRLVDGDNQALYQHLQAANIQCAPRGGGIRFSPHFYTPAAQVLAAVESVQHFLGSPQHAHNK